MCVYIYVCFTTHLNVVLCNVFSVPVPCSLSHEVRCGIFCCGIRKFGVLGHLIWVYQGNVTW